MSDYDDLIADAPLWLYANNRDLVASMADLVRMAEEQVVQRLDHDAFRSLITGKTVGTDGLLDLSGEADPVLEVRAIRVQHKSVGWVPLERRDLEQLTMLYPTSKPGSPRFYAEYDGPLSLKLFPAPSASMAVQVTANVTPDPLTSVNKTNILTTSFYRVIEKATFRQSALFMKNEADVAMYTTELNDAIQEANAQIARRRRDVTGSRPVEEANLKG